MAEQVVDLTNLRTLDEIRKAFETLKCNEDKTDEELENLLSSHRLLIYHSFLIQNMKVVDNGLEYGMDYSQIVLVIQNFF